MTPDRYPPRRGGLAILAGTAVLLVVVVLIFWALFNIGAGR